ncbi:MAG: hypothetical protein A2Y78_15155 [Acidobacteria bacterium RBG_13_68_16]|nr:MAG: hypothetical protein A2Y78_15155 [Acidobacteria bacterium RBG_13_68_16]
MTRKVAGMSLVALFLILSGSSAIAQINPLPFGIIIAEQSRPSFSVVGAGARSAGMGGAFTALADDAAAASFNPAGLALLVKPEVTVVGVGTRRTDLYRGFIAIDAQRREGYGDSQVAFDTTDLNFAAFTVPFEVARRNLCVQLSYHKAIDFTYSGDRSFGAASLTTGVVDAYYRQFVEQSGDIHTYSLALAYELTQRLSLGVSLSRWEGSWTFATLDVQHDVASGSDSYFAYQQNNHLEGWNWNAGALLRYRYLNVGAMYRFDFDADYAFDSALATNISTPLTGEPRLRRPLHWPRSWTVGIAVKPTDTWHITADYARYDWSKMEIKNLGESGTDRYNFFDFRLSDQTTTPDIGQWRFGSEFTFFAGRTLMALRGGYFREGQPQRLAFSGHQSTVDGYSGGFGIKVGRFSVDLAYQRRQGTELRAQFIDPRQIASGKLQATAKGEVRTTDQRLYLALLYQFPSSEGVNKVLHFLFVGPNENKGQDAP